MLARQTWIAIGFAVWGVMLAHRFYRATRAIPEARVRALAEYGDDARSVSNYVSGAKQAMRHAWRFNAWLAVWYAFSLATWLFPV